MIRIHPLCTLALGLAFAAGGALAQTKAPVAAKAYEFYVTPLPNTHQLVDMRMTMEMRTDRQAGAITVKSTMTQTLDTGPLDATGRMTMNSELVHGPTEMRNPAGALMPAPPAGPPMRFSAVLDSKTGRYENIAMEGEAFKALPQEAQEMTFRQMFDALAKLEGAKLRIGESIDIPISMNLPLPPEQQASMAGKLNARYTLRRVDKGIADFDIGVQFDMAIKPDAGASAVAAQMQMQMTAEGKGLLRLRLADRLAQRNTLSMSMQLNVETPEGMKMPMQMRMAIDATGSVRKAASAVKR